MEQANYAELEAHKLEHQKLVEQLDQLCRKHLTEDKPIYFEVLRFLKTWLKEHIMGVDTKYSIALQQTGFALAAWELEAAKAFDVMIEKTGRWWRIW
jgi:hemerythrin